MATKTFLTMKTTMARYIKYPTDTEVLTICGDQINNAVDAVINVRNWSWLMATSGFGLVASDNSYPVPTDFRQQRNLSLLNTAGEIARRVGWEEPKIFDSRYAQGDTDTANAGTPTAYTITDPYPSGVIRFDRIPDSSTIETYPSGQIMYYSRVVELVADSDVLSLPPEVEDMVWWYAASTVAATFAKDQVDYAESRWRFIWRQLKRNESDNPDVRRR